MGALGYSTRLPVIAGVNILGMYFNGGWWTDATALANDSCGFVCCAVLPSLVLALVALDFDYGKDLMATVTNPLRIDPTRTATLRGRFVSEMNRRFAEVKRSVRELVVAQDAFGLIESEPFTFNVDVPRQAWRFRTDSQKLEAFNKWFQGEVDQKILSVDVKGEPWTAKYVDSAYRKGSIRAYTDVHKESLSQSPDFYEGSKKQFLESAFNQPERLSKLRLLGTRVFSELKGVTAVMGQQMSRTLAEGIAQGYHPQKIARSLSKTVDGITRQRARTIARTEVIHAHAEGQLDSFEDLGVEKIGLMAEWSAAPDDRTCSLCADMDGAVMTIAEARGLIPRHPNCRCCWVPANVGEKKKGRMWTKTQKERSVARSLISELPERRRIVGRPRSEWPKVPISIRVARGQSRWLGKEKHYTTPGKAKVAAGKKLAKREVAVVPRPRPGTAPRPKPKLMPKKPVKVLPKATIPGDKITAKTERLKKELDAAIAQRKAAEIKLKTMQDKIKGMKTQLQKAGVPVPTEEEIAAFIPDWEPSMDIGKIKEVFAQRFGIFDINFGEIPKKKALEILNQIGEETTRILRRNPRIARLISEGGYDIGVRYLELINRKSIHGDAAGIYYGRSQTIELAVKGKAVGRQSLNFGKNVFTVSGDNVVGNWRHEFGHHVQKIYKASKVEGLKQHWGELYRSKSKSWWEKYLGNYGASEPSEAFAESFSAWNSPKYGLKGKRLPAEIEDFFEKVVRG